LTGWPLSEPQGGPSSVAKEYSRQRIITGLAHVYPPPCRGGKKNSPEGREQGGGTAYIAVLKPSLHRGTDDQPDPQPKKRYQKESGRQVSKSSRENSGGEGTFYKEEYTFAGKEKNQGKGTDPLPRSETVARLSWIWQKKKKKAHPLPFPYKKGAGIIPKRGRHERSLQTQSGLRISGRYRGTNSLHAFLARPPEAVRAVRGWGAAAKGRPRPKKRVRGRVARAGKPCRPGNFLRVLKSRSVKRRRPKRSFRLGRNRPPLRQVPKGKSARVTQGPVRRGGVRYRRDAKRSPGPAWGQGPGRAAGLGRDRVPKGVPSTKRAPCLGKEAF